MITNIFTLASSTGAPMLSISPFGAFTQNISSSNAFTIQDGSGNNVLNIDTSSSNTNNSFDIYASAGQTSNLLNFYDSGGTTVLAAFDLTGRLGLGTSTPQYSLTSFSSTAPQLSLSAGAGIAQWVMRNAGGNLYLATTTVVGTATTSTSILSINGTTGAISIATTTVGCLNTNGSGLIYSATCSSGTGLSSYDAWTHPSAGVSATTSILSFGYSSSTSYSSFATASTTNLIMGGQTFNNLVGAGLSNNGGTLTNTGVLNNVGNWAGTGKCITLAIFKLLARILLVLAQVMPLPLNQRSLSPPPHQAQLTAKPSASILYPLPAL